MLITSLHKKRLCQEGRREGAADPPERQIPAPTGDAYGGGSPSRVVPKWKWQG